MCAQRGLSDCPECGGRKSGWFAALCRKCRDRHRASELAAGWRQRFYGYIQVTDDCWLWTGGRNPKGYGVFKVSGVGFRGAHRVAWELANGPAPAGLCVLHHCDNPRCVRVDHLFLGTKADNSADMVAKGRQSHGERHAQLVSAGRRRTQ